MRTTYLTRNGIETLDGPASIAVTQEESEYGETAWYDPLGRRLTEWTTADVLVLSVVGERVIAKLEADAERENAAAMEVSRG